MVRLVSENTDKELAIARALGEVDRALAVLAANILRVVRGAGRPYELGEQAAAFLKALDAHWEAAGCGVSSDVLAEALSHPEPRHLIGKFSDDEVELKYAEHEIVRGALQIVASALLEQRTQETAGRSELNEGVREMARVREARRKSWEQKKAPAKRPAARKANARPTKKPAG